MTHLASVQGPFGGHHSAGAIDRKEGHATIIFAHAQPDIAGQNLGRRANKGSMYGVWQANIVNSPPSTARDMHLLGFGRQGPTNRQAVQTRWARLNHGGPKGADWKRKRAEQ